MCNVSIISNQSKMNLTLTSYACTSWYSWFSRWFLVTLNTGTFCNSQTVCEHRLHLSFKSKRQDYMRSRERRGRSGTEKRTKDVKEAESRFFAVTVSIIGFPSCLREEKTSSPFIKILISWCFIPLTVHIIFLVFQWVFIPYDRLICYLLDLVWRF